MGATRDMRPKTKKSCLKCSKSFQSVGIENRICRHCKDLHDWKDSVNIYNLQPGIASQNKGIKFDC